jgi:predicted Zn-dependent protease
VKLKKRGGLNFYSPERELELGDQLSRDLEASLHLMEDPLVVSYVSEVAERIARQSETRLPVRVRVIDSSVLDAYSLPGGYLYITTGMLLETGSEAELAVILSHEIAHVACRHATRQMTRGQLMNYFSMMLLFVSGPVGMALQQGVSVAFPLSFLKFTRGAELEADTVGLSYMYASGYDPAAAIAFFERVESRQKEKHPGIVRIFSTHPVTKDRLAAISRVLGSLPERDDYVVSTSRHDEVIAYLAQSGATPDSAVPVLRKKIHFPAPEP